MPSNVELRVVMADFAEVAELIRASKALIDAHGRMGPYVHPGSKDQVPAWERFVEAFEALKEQPNA